MKSLQIYKIQEMTLFYFFKLLTRLVWQHDSQIALRTYSYITFVQFYSTLLSVYLFCDVVQGYNLTLLSRAQRGEARPHLCAELSVAKAR